MFSPNMMLHVLFFLGVLRDEEQTELCLLSGSPCETACTGHFRQALAILYDSMKRGACLLL